MDATAQRVQYQRLISHVLSLLRFAWRVRRAVTTHVSRFWTTAWRPPLSRTLCCYRCQLLPADKVASNSAIGLAERNSGLIPLLSLTSASFGPMVLLDTPSSAKCSTVGWGDGSAIGWGVAPLISGNRDVVSARSCRRTRRADPFEHYRASVDRGPEGGRT